MLTAWCLALGFFIPWVVGAPVYWLLRGGRVLRPGEWLWVPFAGLAAIVCVLQPLTVFGDLTLAQTTRWFWVGSGGSWIPFLAFPSGRGSLRTIPRGIVLLALAVYLGQGVGVVAKGIERYRGDLHSDQYHYIVIAQFLMDEAFSTGWEDVGERPWLVPAVMLKSDRIGQSVIHGFFAVTAGRESLDMFFPTVLLGPALMIPAMFLLGPQCGLPRRWTTWAALCAGAAPGIEVLVSGCFLAHALCMATLVAYLAAIIRLARGGSYRTLPGAFVTLVLGISVYPEFAFLFAGCAVVAFTAGWWHRHVTLTRVAIVGASLLVGCVLNPAAATSALAVWNRSATVGAEMRTGCPHSVWVACVWLHYEKASLTGGRVDFTIAHVYFYGVTAAALLGGIVLATSAVRSRRRMLPSLACPALLVPPLLVRFLRPECEYIICKLILTLAPVLVAFLACGLFALSQWKHGRRLALASAYFVFTMLAIQSGLEQRSRLRGGDDMGPAQVWNDPQLRQVCDELRHSQPSTVVIAIYPDGGGRSPAAASSTVCYYARHHRIRLAAPHRAWMVDLDDVPTPQLRQISDLPPGTLLVTRDHPLLLSGTSHEVLVKNGAYQLVRLSEPGSVLPTALASLGR